MHPFFFLCLFAQLNILFFNFLYKPKNSCQKLWTFQHNNFHENRPPSQMRLRSSQTSAPIHANSSTYLNETIKSSTLTAPHTIPYKNGASMHLHRFTTLTCLFVYTPVYGKRTKSVTPHRLNGFFIFLISQSFSCFACS